MAIAYPPFPAAPASARMKGAAVRSALPCICVFVMFINRKTAEKPFFTIQKHVAYATPRITGGYKFITLIGSIWSWFFIILLAYSIKLLYG